MFLLLASLIILPISFAQTDTEILEKYIQRFKLKGVTTPPKREALYELGLKLFHDKNLSGNGNISCQSCHSLKGYSGDTLPLGVGEGAEGVAELRFQKNGLILPRHTPAIYNLGYPAIKSLFWDGRVSKDRNGYWQTPESKLNGSSPELKDVAKTLDSLLAMQALFPLANPAEMLGKKSTLTKIEAWELVLKKIFEGPSKAIYQKLFKSAFPEQTEFNIGHVGNAIAEFERHDFKADSTLWDLYLKGDKEILSNRMKSGAVIFIGKGKCTNCHAGEHFSNFSFQNIGIPQVGPGVKDGDDQGRLLVTTNPRDLYKFRTPPLRNIGLTAPYMHSGIFKSLWEVINHYNDPVATLRHFNWEARHPHYTDPLNIDSDPIKLDNKERLLSIALTKSLGLTHEQRADLFCFLAVALTDVELQDDLISKGILNEITDCSPRPL